MAPEKRGNQENGRGAALDYARRHRKAEWRSRWFHLHRTEDEDELIRIREKGLSDKRRMIEKQSEKAKHRAGYAPAGPGTPWFSIGPRNVNGRVKSLAVHPADKNIVYAGAASGGLWKTVDGGQSWRSLWDTQESLAVGSIAIAESAPETVYVGTGEWTPAGDRAIPEPVSTCQPMGARPGPGGRRW